MYWVDIGITGGLEGFPHFLLMDLNIHLTPLINSKQFCFYFLGVVTGVVTKVKV